MTHPTRHRPAALTGAPVLALALALLTACSSGPSQEERVTLARDAYTTVTTLGNEANDRLLAFYPDLDLDLTTSASGPGLGNWYACSSESYSDRYDSPERSGWRDSIVYTLEPRQPTDNLVEPFAQTYLDDGWTLSIDRLDQDPPELVLTKDNYRLVITGMTQEHLDHVPNVDAYLDIIFYSPCLPSPANLTEWSRYHPEDFDLPGRTS